MQFSFIIFSLSRDRFLLSLHLEQLVIPIGRTQQGRHPISTTPRTRGHLVAGAVQDLKTEISRSPSISHFSSEPQAAKAHRRNKGKDNSFMAVNTTLRFIDKYTTYRRPREPADKIREEDSIEGIL